MRRSETWDVRDRQPGKLPLGLFDEIRKKAILVESDDDDLGQPLYLGQG